MLLAEILYQESLRGRVHRRVGTARTIKMNIDLFQCGDALLHRGVDHRQETGYLLLRIDDLDHDGQVL